MMIPLKHIRFFLSVLLATLATAAMADPPTWDPTIPDTTTFEALKVKLLDPNAVNAVLYLDNRCRVLALVVPQEGERSSFAPQFEDISNKWWLRKQRYSPLQTYNNCLQKPKWKFLNSELKDDIGDPNACKPNKFVDANGLQSATCLIDVGKVDTVVALDKFFGTIVIVTGELAQVAAHGEIPAAELGRTEDGVQEGQPCYPPVPNPCPAGQNGTYKCVKSSCTCMCQ